MRLLLDTHVALWCVQGVGMSVAATAAIEEADEVVLSVVTPWEWVIKAALGKITLHESPADIAQEIVREFGARVLPIGLPHVLAVGALPPHHGDPFDRLLVAQASVEGLTVVTRDRWFEAYGVAIVTA